MSDSSISINIKGAAKPMRPHIHQGASWGRGLFEPDLFHCPFCGQDYTHIDEVGISVPRVYVPGYPRHNEITVNANSGKVVTHGEKPLPAGVQVGTGDRHRIGLYGYCEMCPGTFALIFTQHKGNTFCEVVIDDREQ